MRTVLIGDEVVVTKKGAQRDPEGSRYCVLDYANDDCAKVAARIMASQSMSRESAYAEALFASLQGEDETPPLLIYEIEPQVEVPEGARYIVCNFPRHYPSRLAMRLYALKARDVDPEVAALVIQLIYDSEQEFAEYVTSKLPKRDKKKRKKRT